MNYFNESFKEETEMKKSFDKTKIGEMLHLLVLLTMQA